MRGCPLIAMYIGLKKRPRGQAAGGDEYASFLDAQSRTGTEREQRIEDLGCSDRSHITSHRSLGRSAIRDFGVSQNLRPPSSNSRRKTHRTRPPASKCDGRAAFDGSQCVCILSLSHSALRLSIVCRKPRHGDQDIRGDARNLEILTWSQCEFVESQRHTNGPSFCVT